MSTCAKGSSPNLIVGQNLESESSCSDTRKRLKFLKRFKEGGKVTAYFTVKGWEVISILGCHCTGKNNIYKNINSAKGTVYTSSRKKKFPLLPPSEEDIIFHTGNTPIFYSSLIFFLLLCPSCTHILISF